MRGRFRERTSARIAHTGILINFAKKIYKYENITSKWEK